MATVELFPTPVVVEATDQQVILEVAAFGASAVPSTYTHDQPGALSSWIINHNLGRKVDVTLYSVGGVEMLADITHTSVNQAIVSFVQATAGTALVA